jgi:hypothetical protein
MNEKNSVISRIIITIISFFVLLGSSLLASCAKQSSQEIVESVPYVFEGVMQAGVENAPPVEVILDTELPVVPEKVPVYQVQTVDEEYAQALASRLGFNDGGSRPDNVSDPYVFSRDSGSGRFEGDAMRLEVYQDGRISMYGPGPSIKNAPENLPSFEEATKIARDWLVSYNLYPPNVINVEKGGGLVVTKAATGESIPYSTIVKFETSLGDYDVYTPGARVEIGDNGKILHVWVNIAQLKEYGFVSIKTPEAALNLLKARLASLSANPPEARETIINLRYFEQLSLTRVTLQYAYGGGYLQPIYVFEGNAYSEQDPNLDAFRGKVDAVAR